MSSKTYTSAMFGLQPIKIEVEVDTTRGQPKLIIIGLPSQTVYEAKERITSALQNCGVRIKAKRTVVNLAPADIRKNDSCFELAIVASLLKEYGLLKRNTDDIIFFGELALSGELKPMRATLPLLIAAKKMGFSTAILPAANAHEVAHIHGITVKTVQHLNEFLAFAQGESLPTISPKKYTPKLHNTTKLDDIIGHRQAKRALEIASAGKHNMLMVGPPGSGKSLLARAITSLLPPLNQEEAIETSQIHSLVGTLTTGLITTRPFRDPHHSTSQTGLLGGGHDLHPGEISLAHQGVLFLDEINEFSRQSLEALREPLEKKSITITRAQGTTKYPADFALIAAGNPCPCGFAGATTKSCRCTAYQIKRYQQKLSGPLRDRIDLHLFVEPVPPNKLQQKSSKSTAKQIKKRISKAYQVQTERYQNTRFSSNASLTSAGVRELCQLSSKAQSLIKKAGTNLSLSTRSYFSVIAVGQTIADLAGAKTIQAHHIAEALQFR